MPILLTISLLLAIIVIQDFKNRSIHWFTLPLLFIGLYFYRIDSITYADILLNILFIFIIIGSMILYLRFRQKEWVNPTHDFFGWGDILFLIAITPSSNFRNFMFLFIIGTVFSLILTLLIRLFKANFEIIPYAGMFAIFMISYLLYNFYNPLFSFYNIFN